MPVKIKITDHTGFYFVDALQITHCICDNGCVIVFTTDKKKHVTCQPLSSIEEDLKTTDKFVRIHDSTLINLDFVKKYIRGNGGIVLTKEGTELGVSKRRKKEFLMRYSN